MFYGDFIRFGVALAKRESERVSMGDQVPHFEVTTIDGRRVRYADIWQHRNLVLVVARNAGERAGSNYLNDLRTALQQFHADTELVVTHLPVAALPDAEAVVADRWGEIVYIARSTDERAHPPDIAELAEWVQFVRLQCPECPP